MFVNTQLRFQLRSALFACIVNICGEKRFVSYLITRSGILNLSNLFFIRKVIMEIVSSREQIIKYKEIMAKGERFYSA